MQNPGPVFSSKSDVFIVTSEKIQMFQFIRTTVLGGIVFLIPVIVFLVVIRQTEEEKMHMERRVREAEFAAARIVEECERR